MVQFSIYGSVIDTKSQGGITGLQVEAWSKDGNSPHLIGSAETGKEGRFEIISSERYNELFQGRVHGVVFKLYSGGELIAGTDDFSVRKITGEGAEVSIAIDYSRHTPVGGAVTVKGFVYHLNASPVQGITVAALERSLRKDNLIGKTETDGRGCYEFTFTPQQFKLNPDSPVLQLEVLDRQGKVITTSEMLLDLKEINKVHFIIDSPDYKGLSRFQKALQSISPHVGDVQYTELAENGRQQDISYLSRRSGKTLREVDRFVKAKQFSEQTKIPAEAFYSLLKKNLPADLNVLLCQKQGVIAAALDQAAKNNLIDTAVAEKKDEILEQFGRARVDWMLSAKRGQAEASLGDILSLATSDAKLHRKLLLSYISFEGEPKDFWNNFKKELGNKDLVAKIQLTLQLAWLTGNQTAIMKSLLSEENQTFRDLRPYAKYDLQDWQQRINEVSQSEKRLCVPPAIEGKDDQEKIRNYASAMARIVRDTVPTAVFAARLERDSTSKSPFDGCKSELSAFFNNNPDFEFMKHTTYTLTAGGTLYKFDGVKEKDKLIGVLKSIQRVFRLAPSYEAVAALYAGGLDSSFGIAQLPRQHFVEKYAMPLGGEDTARAVYQQATKTYMTALEICTELHPNLNLGPYVIPQQGIQPAGGAAPQDDQGIPEPDLRTMFGSLEQCDCEECQTVYSPAAYLVDILHFLEQRAPDVFQELKRRRGDLLDIDLSCKNTNTPLPYVDLVLERLEPLVMVLKGIYGSFILAESYQTVGTAEELAGNPEHYKRYYNQDGKKVYQDVSQSAAGAYNFVKNSVFPAELPFNLPLEESRIYLNHLGISRAELMQQFLPVNQSTDRYDPSDYNWAAEYLGISPQEATIITQIVDMGASIGVWNFYGFDKANGFTPIADPASTGQVITAGNWNDVLAGRVDVFLQQTGLQYTEMLYLLDTRYVNPVDSSGKRKITVVANSEKTSDPVTCVLEYLQLAGMEPGDLTRMHRFIRLWRRLGWKMYELDMAIASLSRLTESPLTSYFNRKDDLVQLAYAVWASKQFNLSVGTVAAFWGDINTTIYTDYDRDDQPGIASLYDALFRNKAVINPPDPAYDDIFNGIAKSFGGHSAGILAAVQITDADLSLLTKNLNIDTSSTNTLTLRVLSNLYRHAVLARALHLSSKDFLTVKAIIGLDPFGSPRETLSFVSMLDAIRTSSFSITQLDYLLRHQYTEDTGAAPTDQSITLFLTDLQAGLRKIELSAAPGTTSGAASDLSGTTPDTAQTRDELVQSKKNLIKQKFVEALKLSPAAAKLLLEETVVSSSSNQSRLFIEDFMDEAFISGEATSGTASGVLTPDLYPAQYNGFRLIDKISAFITGLKIADEELPYIVKSYNELGITNLAALPLTPTAGAAFREFKNLIDLVRARDMLPFGTPGLSDIFKPLFMHSQDPGGNAKERWLEQLEQRTHWGGLVTDLVGDKDALQGGGILKTNFPGDFKTGSLLLLIGKCRDAVKRIGLSAHQIAAEIRADLADADSQAVKNAAKARHEESEWYSIAKPLQDVLREKRRQALVAYVVAHPDHQSNLSWRNINDLYEYLLIDVEMSPLLMTSRIKQAISSVQLFIDRVLMNLEHANMDKTTPPLKLHPDQIDEWEQWRKLYRIWEANRKIFLYPENWLEPELRDDKSPFFKELEAQLRQNELSPENVEDAFLGYLEKLDSVARLEIKCVYHQVDADYDIDIVHVIGRTYGAPHKYYYRKLENGEWTAWEKVELDIEGDHLALFVWNRRLYLFWLMFTKKAQDVDITISQGDKSSATSGTSSVISYNEDSDIGQMQQGFYSAEATGDSSSGTTLPKAPLYWQIQLAWSERKKNKWLPRKMSKESINFSPFVNCTNEDVLNAIRDKFYFCLYPAATELRFLFLMQSEGVNGSIPNTLYQLVWVYFSFRDGNSDPVAINSYNPNNCKTYTLPKNICGSQMMLRQIDSQEGLYFSNDGAYLSSAPNGLYRLVVPSNALLFDNPLGDIFFFQDDVNTFFARYELEEMEDSVSASGNTTDPLNHNEHWVYKDNQIPDLAGPVEGWEELEDILSQFTNPVDEETAQGAAIINSSGTTISLNGKTFSGSGLAATLQQGAYRAGKYDAGIVMKQPQAGTGKTTLMMTCAPSVLRGLGGSTSAQTREASYHYEQRLAFHSHYHPHVQTFIAMLNVYGVDGMLKRALPTLLSFEDTMNFPSCYAPNNAIVKSSFPSDLVDFDYGGAYSQYNWELFFHLPMLVATRLSQDQRFEEARKWFHYVFDPTCSEGGGKERFWRFKPFYDLAGKKIETLDDLMTNAAELAEQVDKWMQDPFKPHVIARMRRLAYMKNVVMKYIDNLLAWADQLFRRDTIEAINEATQLYVLAAKILGERPQRVPPRARPKVQSYSKLDTDLDLFSNAMVDIELFIPPSAPANTNNNSGNSLGRMAYFGLAKNEKLLEYWDVVADRLFKIRNCMNIEGIVRQLPLFEPPIDPGLLVKAAAAGMDLGSILNDLSANTPYYRFNFMLQKALELCNDVKSLGGVLLSALEKKDAEALALLRQSHEMNMLDAIRYVKERQVEETKENLDALNKTRIVVQGKLTYYSSRPYMNNYESQHLNSMQTGLILQGVQGGIETLSTFLSALPDIKIGAPTGMGATYGGANLGMVLKAFSSYMGIMIGINNTTGAMAATQGGYQRRMDDWKFQADSAKKELAQIDKQILAAQIRQAIAEKELQNQEMQIENAREINDFMSNKYTNQELYEWMVGQVATVYFQSYQIAYDLAKKAEKCYQWELGIEDSSFIQFGYWDSMRKGLLSGEKLQYDLRRIEASYLEQNKREFELTKHISLVLLDPVSLLELQTNGKCTVHIPEVLFDLDYPGHYFRRIKSVSLSIPCVAGPYTTINCTLRLKNHATRKRTMLKTSGEPYGTTDYASDSDPSTGRFRYVPNESQSVATSSAQNDSGVFELSFRDERYLPFEGCGVISAWEIGLTEDQNLRQFDYKTISDVIIHLKYTAREDAILKDPAIAYAKKVIEAGVNRDANPLPLVRLFSLKHDFPTEWYKFLHPQDDCDNELQMVISKDRFPFFAKDKNVEITAIDFYAKCSDSSEYKVQLSPPVTVSDPLVDSDAGLFTLTAPYTFTDGRPGIIHHGQKAPVTVSLPTSSSPWILKVRKTGVTNFLSLTEAEMEDIYLALSYKLS